MPPLDLAALLAALSETILQGVQTLVQVPFIVIYAALRIFGFDLFDV